MLKSTAEYLKEYRSFQPDKDAMRIAVLASFTLQGMSQVLTVRCKEKGISVICYDAPYNQYAQEIIDEKSGLYEFNPDAVILCIDTRSLFGDYLMYAHTYTPEQRREIINIKKTYVTELVNMLASRSKSKILLMNNEQPQHTVLGIIDSKQDYGLRQSIADYNEQVRAAYEKSSQVFIVDFAQFCTRYGSNVFDPKMYYLADMKISPAYFPQLCDEYIPYIVAFKAKSRKCIVLDLDNTLWGGILGEDGLEGIKLGPTPNGRPFLEFQQCLHALFHRGMLLAVNSKNNMDDVREVFARHPYQVLKEEHFAALRINWEDKELNIKSIAEELNIGMDSMIFLDDDPVQCSRVQSQLPDVHVIQLNDPSRSIDSLMSLPEFAVLQFTDEDKSKGKMYVEQRKRLELRQSVSIDDFLRGLKMKVVIQRADSFTMPRIAQLTQKTNQFNMTTKRYTEQEIAAFAASGLVASVAVKDTFGDNGIIGTVIVEKGELKPGTQSTWKIDTFLLSCRIIGRKIEDALLAYILKCAAKESVKEIIAEFIPTKKNKVAENFYKNNGFALAEKRDGKEVWAYYLHDAKPGKYPEFIDIEEK